MHVKSIAECSKGEHSAILLTFIKLPVVFKTFVLSIFEWPFYKVFRKHSGSVVECKNRRNETVLLRTQNIC